MESYWKLFVHNIFSVNWIFSYCMIRVLVVICRYYLLILSISEIYSKLFDICQVPFVEDVFMEMFYVNVHFVKDDILY